MEPITFIVRGLAEEAGKCFGVLLEGNRIGIHKLYVERFTHISMLYGISIAELLRRGSIVVGDERINFSDYQLERVEFSSIYDAPFILRNIFLQKS